MFRKIINRFRNLEPNRADEADAYGPAYEYCPKCYADLTQQKGYGFTASSAKSDIYEVGILLNVMLTGKYPKEQRASGRLWEIIERCIRLEAEERYTAGEMIESLEKVTKEKNLEEL